MNKLTKFFTVAALAGLFLLPLLAEAGVQRLVTSSVLLKSIRMQSKLCLQKITAQLR